ncbi:MAG: BamA/TamA family outer membrane protein [Deltaproteobacteria bacterium]|nr:BamA/TamA family outer membrane protein [Deltaproteobacteria bacterium]
MRDSIRIVQCLIFLCLLAAASAFAAAPDAGTLLNEQRQPGPGLPDRLPADREREAVRAPLADSGVKVLVKGFRFTGGEGVATEAELQTLTAGSIGRELSFAELQQLANRVTEYLREKRGYLLARAYLPAQDVTAGIVEIAIVAGYIEGKVRIRVQGASRIRPSLLEGIADRAVPEGSAVRMEKIERAVLLMNDLPGMSTRASLERGETPGTSRVVISAEEGPLVRGLVSGDNYGDRFTGIWRGTGQVSALDPFGAGDQLSVSLTGAEHMLQGRAAYDLPLGATGVTWSTSYTALTYELGADLESLKASGRAETFGTGLRYPLLRSRNASLWTGLGFEYMALCDEANDVRIRHREIPMGNASLSATAFDTFGGGGLTSASLVLTGGSVDLSGVAANDAADAAGPRTSGSFLKGTYSLARLQRLSRELSLFGALRGQIASGNLDSSQKFILGGPSGVRSYPVGEAPGDEGHALTLETRFDLPGMPAWAATQLVGFWDAGWVKLHKELWPGAITNGSGRNDYWLSGGGIGINVGKAGLYSIRVSYAHNIGPNDGRSPDGKDSDNRSDDGRFWLQLIVWL